MPAPHPPEFRQRAVEFAQLGEKPISDIAREIGISESCLRNWVHQAEANGGDRSGLTMDEAPSGCVSGEPGAGDGDRNPQACERVLCAGAHPRKMIYRLVRELAADGVLVAVTCRVLRLSTSGFNDWWHRPLTERDLANAYLFNEIIDIFRASRNT